MDHSTDLNDRRKRNTNTSVGDTRVLLTALSGERGPPPGAAEEFFWLFSQFGVVEKISIFKKQSKHQIFTQYDKPESCSKALNSLNGSAVTLFDKLADGPYKFELAALPSFLVELTFKKINSRNREYKKENFLINEMLKIDKFPDQALDFLWNNHIKGEGWLIPKQPDHMRGHIPEGPGIPKGTRGDCAYIAGFPGDGSNPAMMFTAEHLFRIASIFGTVLCARKVKKGDGGTFLVQFDHKQACERFVTFMNGIPLGDTILRAEESIYGNTMFWINSGAQEIQANIFMLNERDVRPEILPSEFLDKMLLSEWIGVQGVDEETGCQLLESVLGREIENSDSLPDSSPSAEIPAIAGPLEVIEILRAIGILHGKITPRGIAVAYFLQVANTSYIDDPPLGLLDGIDYDELFGRSVTGTYQGPVFQYRSSTIQ